MRIPIILYFYTHYIKLRIHTVIGKLTEEPNQFDLIKLVLLDL